MIKQSTEGRKKKTYCMEAEESQSTQQIKKAFTTLQKNH